jgi:hypothetical protein
MIERSIVVFFFGSINYFLYSFYFNNNINDNNKKELLE